MIPGLQPYEPRGAARELFLCKAEEILIEGPAGTGKSRAVLEKINACLLKYPGARGLISRKTRASMSESVLVTLEKVIPKNSELYPATDDMQRNTRKSYRYPNGSELVVCGLDNSERIMSTEFDIIGVFEGTEINLLDYDNLTTRLRNGVMPYQQIIIDINPAAPSHWINQRANAGTMKRLLSRHEDNPGLWDGSDWTEQGTKYIARLDRLTGARKLRLRFGKWAQAEGVVYESFDPAIHVVDQFDIPENWRRIRSIDFGFVNPFTCQWWAIDPDGRMFLYRELYGTKKLVQDWAEKINSLSAGEKYEATISDHDAEDRATLAKYGINTIAAYKTVTTGIQAVEARLTKAEDDKPRLFLMRDSLVERDVMLDEDHKPCSLAEEYESYVYPKTREGRSVKEEPVKEYDHGQDAQRYAVAYVDKLGKKAVSFHVLGGSKTDQAQKTVITTTEKSSTVDHSKIRDRNIWTSL